MSKKSDVDQPAAPSPSPAPRRESRLSCEETLHIQVQRGAIDLDGLVLTCNTRDVSRSGFNVRAERPLLLGVILEVLIALPELQPPFLLTAEARWCKPLDDGGFSIGFVILDAMHSDYQAWRDTLDECDPGLVPLT